MNCIGLGVTKSRMTEQLSLSLCKLLPNTAAFRKGFFFDFHQENLVAFLEVNLTKLWCSPKIEAPHQEFMQP